METLIQLLLLSLATAAFSMSVAFGKPTRFLRSRSWPLGSLFKCAFCLNHWVAFVLVYLSQPSYYLSLDTFVHVFAVITMASIFSLPIFVLFDSIDNG